MRRSLLIPVVMAAVVLGAPGQRLAAADRIIGDLVDSSCYIAKGAELGGGAAHKECAITCAQKGSRLALVTAKGEVYMITGALTLNNNAKLIPLIGQPVALTGTLGLLSDLTVELAVLPPTDGRRQTGEKDGVVNKKKFRKGDFREGDIPESAVWAIDALLAEPASAVRLQ